MSLKTVPTSDLNAIDWSPQIYLPINNALSDVGHVHFFLDQIGQGVQHVACKSHALSQIPPTPALSTLPHGRTDTSPERIAGRVKDLTWFIARVNAYRDITGKGFTFLNIPPSYYGTHDHTFFVATTTI